MTLSKRSVVRYALLAFITLTGLTAKNAAAADDPMSRATYIGEKQCISCHGQENEHFKDTLHAKVFRQNPKNNSERQVCESCHGPGSLHAKDAENKKLIIGFTKEWGTPVEKQKQQCLSCHQGGNRMHWPGSAHDSNKLSCSDCHNPMAKFSAQGLLKKASINETCMTCHQQQRSEFHKRSHMPLPEGKMSCVDCHNPHGSVTKPLLKADNVNELCYSCHAEKRGPFIWEHAPVRENCLNCHQAHGSNHDKLMRVSRPQLCQQCHLITGHPAALFNAGQLPGGSAAPNVRVMGRSCQNCHSQVHGSNHPAGYRFQR